MIGISAGNHAQALAWGAVAEEIDCLVVMWTGASEAKIAATRGYGATVDLGAADPAEAFERLDALIAETGRTLVHPFDDPVVLAGAGTVALELLEDVPDIETIVVPAGGGGLVAGIAAAAPDRRVIAVEPERSTAVRSGLAAGGSVPVTPVSIADGLSAPFAGEHALAILRRHEVESILVTEEEIETAFRFLYARAKLACEPAAAVGVAAILAGKIHGPGGLRCLGRKRSGRNRLCYPGLAMKAGIHPEYVLTHVRCSCGAEFETRSTQSELHVEICSRLSPVLHGEAEADGSGRSGRALPAPPREGRRRAPRLAQTLANNIGGPGRPRGRDDAQPVDLGGRRAQAERPDRRGRHATSARRWRATGSSGCP